MTGEGFTKGVPRDPAFLSGWLYAVGEGDVLSADDVQAIRYAAELLGQMAGVTQHGNARRRSMAGASLRTRQEEPTMSQRWPENPDETQPIQQPPTEAPGAPHTPESPRQTPEPDDGDNGSEPA